MSYSTRSITPETLSLHAARFPSQLAEINDPPELLYVRGNAAALAGPAIAIVGSRSMTPYGKQVCRKLVRELVQQGIVIVSGLAIGIDSVAHATAVEYGGSTVAVLGNGLNMLSGFSLYRRQLAARIIDRDGVIISEYPPHMPAQKQYFPARNRIIAGLCVATIVVEAAAKSGALITARLAMEYNREVGAVPGSVLSSRSAGVHALLRDGAHLITCADDIIQQLPEIIQHQIANQSSLMPVPNLAQSSTRTQYNSPEQMQLLQLLESGTHDVNQLAQDLHISMSNLSVYLTDLEINGIVRKNSDSTYTLT